LTIPIHPDGYEFVGRYRIERFLDEGGMQQVFVATDRSFGRYVALKIPKDTSAQKRFAQSARLSARINHSNVAKTLDYFEESSRNYLVEELVNGTNLGTLLSDTFDVLDPHLAAHILHHLAKGLSAAHHKGVVHRDLKPTNIMIGDDPTLSVIKITDFGIAKMAEEELSDAFREKTVTGSQTAMGALPYMAPEMVSDPKKASLPADVWAVGAILYRLLAGIPPYGSGLSAVVKIIDAAPPAVPAIFAKKTQFEPLIPELWALVLSCLMKLPEARPTADQLVAACSRLCYSHSSRRTGKILNFGEGPGRWGWIRRDDGVSIFFHEHGYYGEKPTQGVRVNFASFPGAPGRRTFPVLPIKPRSDQ
jgi:serine/threonine protein kinase